MPADRHSQIERWRTRVEDEICASFEDVSSPLADAVTHYPKAGGKCTRPILLFGLYEALGGDFREVFDAGVGLEMIHLSTLVGDDHPVMDDDDMRRGVETVHRVYNPQDALLAANLLLSRGMYRCQSAVSGDSADELMGLLDELVCALSEGQHADMKWTRGDGVITEDKYFEAIRRKTAYIYATVGESAVLLANDREVVCENVSEARQAATQLGHEIGIAHQLYDDVIDFLGDDAGKDQYSDVRSQTQTLVTIRAAEAGIPVFDQEIPLSTRIEQMRDAGVFQSVQETAVERLESAFQQFDSLPIADRDSARALRQYLRVLSTQGTGIAESVS